ncbi:MAG TPA: hypothetical protein VK735_20785 [Pseudonocardia sp.]|uniref:hypothetical protein n=1 Tax=Pseudonocardia sp. TaxID=60912 RepID=UPI002BE499CE|nr:hypothetical protein [Pseudonocardia sp.]HTF49885.1 hypothetical protein [Pseudonocardia sp.]
MDLDAAASPVGAPADALSAAADALYALPRDEFTPARDTAVRDARAAGDKGLATAIGRLRRPTVGAWLVNHLARQRPDEVAALASLGESMRAAHQQLDGAALRRLSEQRRELVNALTRTTKELGKAAGEPASDPVVRELEGMFTAALADPDAARALASGRLSSPKELASAGTLDWPAVAPGTRPRPAPSPPPPAPSDSAPSPSATGGRAKDSAESPAGPSPALVRARQELDRLAATLSEAEDRAAAAHRDFDSAADEEQAAHRAVAERRAELIAAEQAEQQARQRARTARREREDTDRALRDAARRHAVAHDRLTALES